MSEHIHIAIFSWKAPIISPALRDALLLIEGLKEQVPGIIDIVVGKNSSRYSEGYSHVVLVRGESQSAIDAYRAHPDHVRAAAVIDEAEEKGVGVDFVAGAFTSTP